VAGGAAGEVREQGAADVLPHMQRMQQQLAGMRQVLQALAGTAVL
jgi:hypothetical protein